MAVCTECSIIINEHLSAPLLNAHKALIWNSSTLDQNYLCSISRTYMHSKWSRILLTVQLWRWMLFSLLRWCAPNLCVFKSSKVLCLSWLYAHCCKSRTGWQCTVSMLWVGDKCITNPLTACRLGLPAVQFGMFLSWSFSAFPAVSLVWNQNPMRYHTCKQNSHF